jgi:hypothetical protein
VGMDGWVDARWTHELPRSATRRDTNKLQGRKRRRADEGRAEEGERLQAHCVSVSVKKTRSKGLLPPQKDQTWQLHSSATAIPAPSTADEPTAAPNQAIHVF